MINRGVNGCQVELKIVEGGLRCRGQTRNPQETGKSDESLLAKVHTAFCDFLDNRREESVPLLEAALMLGHRYGNNCVPLKECYRSAALNLEII